MTQIGIVGAGIGGLHLALFLQKHGVAVTLYSDRTAEQIRSGRLPNTPARFRNTIRREHELGVAHWDDNLTHMNMFIGGEFPLTFRADLSQAASFIDMRLY